MSKLQAARCTMQEREQELEGTIAANMFHRPLCRRVAVISALSVPRGRVARVVRVCDPVGCVHRYNV